jgi:hypothetical protein
LQCCSSFGGELRKYADYVQLVSAGCYHSDFWNRDYPRIQLITASELLAGKRVEMPPQVSPFSQAAREAERGEQAMLI